MEKPLTYTEINLSAIQHNLSEIKKLISSNVKIMAVVKANAHGHGVIEIAEVINQAIK